MKLKIEKVNWMSGEQQGHFYLLNRKLQFTRGVWKGWMFNVSWGKKYGKFTVHLFKWVISLHTRQESIERQFQMLWDYSIEQII